MKKQKLTDKEIKELFNSKIKEAESDRSLAQPWINEILDFALPLEPKIGYSQSTPINPQALNEMFDTTLHETLSDFGSDMSHLFTPRYEWWINFEPAQSLSEGEKKAIGPSITKYAEAIYTAIEQSNFYQGAGICYRNWGISAMAMEISSGMKNQPIDCQPIPLSELLITRGPNGIFDGRFRDFGSFKRLYLKTIWPNVDKFKNYSEAQQKESVKVRAGCIRDWNSLEQEAWHYAILVGDDVEGYKYYTGAGSCPIIICPFEVGPKTAWKPGPAFTALAPARTLNEIGYQKLKAGAKALDPAYSYEEDGVLNPEGGIDAGTWVSRAPGSEAPQILESGARFDWAVYEETEHRKTIRRIMYQDKPEQSGLTPATAYQWADQKAQNTRRMELPRDIVTNLWVIPAIQRFVYVLAERGELPSVDIKGDNIQLRPISPLSKARDSEDISVTMQMANVLQVLRNMDQGDTINPIDTMTTGQKILRTAKERHITFKTDEQIQAETQQKMMQQNAQMLQQMMGQMQQGAETNGISETTPA